MKCAMIVVGSIAVATASSHADVYRMTMSGILDEVTDNRTSMNDPFDGTALDVDDFTASIGDTWSYEVIFDTDVMTSIVPGQNAIYDAVFESSITVAGRTVDMFYDSFLYYYISDVGGVDAQQMEIWGDIFQSGSVGVYSSFYDFENIDTLINGGQVVDNAAMFDDLDSWNFGIFSNSGDDIRWVAGDGPYQVTIEQIPAPGVMGVLGFGGLLAARRRR